MPSSLDKAIAAIPEPHRTRFIEHLEGGTSADWLARWLKAFGHPVGATTIRKHRRKEIQ